MTMPRLQFRLLKVGHCTHPECIAQRGGRWASMLFPALCGLLRHPQRGWILFDTGYSSHFLDATAQIPERLYRWTTPFSLPPEETMTAQLQRIGIAHGDIAHVVISHLHGDHIAGLRDFPAAGLIAMRAELEAMDQRSRFGNLSHGTLPALLPPDFRQRVGYADDAAQVALPPELRPFEHGFDLFGDGSVLAVHLPGHSRGQLGIVFRQENDRVTFMSADACWSLTALREDRGPTWLARRIFDRNAHYQETFRRLQQMHAGSGSPWLIPSHCAQTWKAYEDTTR
ncbi:MAG: fold metallo-hydrolase [Massilia sp.]|nr:fold metallo-hydrolase [Massilia sp.]